MAPIQLVGGGVPSNVPSGEHSGVDGPRTTDLAGLDDLDFMAKRSPEQKKLRSKTKKGINSKDSAKKAPKNGIYGKN